MGIGFMMVGPLIRISIWYHQKYLANGSGSGNGNGNGNGIHTSCCFILKLGSTDHRINLKVEKKIPRDCS